MNSESVWYGAPPPEEPLPAADTLPEDARHVRLRENARFFLPLSLALGAVFALLFVNAYALGLNAALLAAAMDGATLLALGRLGMRDRKRDAFWAVSLLLLGVSVFWTANAMTQDVSFFGMFLAELLWLMNAFADILSWRFGRVVSGGFRLVGRIITHLPEPFRHAAALRRGGSKNARSVLLGLVIAVPLVWVVASLLVSADAAFGALLRRLFGVWSVSETVRTALRSIFYTLIPAAVFYSALAAQTDRSEFPAKEKRRASALVAVTFTGVLAVVYAVFCGVQIAVLFAGDISALPEGMTYAEYAREGFFQLLLVSAINVALIIFAQRRFAPSRALRALLVFLTACTYIMEASSAMRMMLYVNAYGLTYLRLLVLWFLVLLALILGAAVYTVFHADFRLFRFTLAACMALWLVFAFARPDAIAARYDLARRGLDDTTEALIAYDSSYDAIPALRPYASQIAERGTDSTAYLNLTVSVVRDYSERGVRSFNFSVWQAMKTAEDYVHGN